MTSLVASNPETRISKPGRKSNLVLSLFWTGLKFSFLSYFLLLVYVIYGVYFPSTCKFSKAKDLQSYSRFCIEPLYELNANLDIALYAGLKGFSSSSLNLKDTRPIWINFGHPSNKLLDTIVTVPLDEKIRVDGHTLYGRIVITKSSTTVPYETTDSDLLSSFNPQPNEAIHIPIQLSKLQYPRQQNIYHDLLNSSQSHQQQLQQQSSSENEAYVRKQHWKYGIHPLIIRYIDYNNLVFNNPFLPQLEEYLDVRTITQTTPQKSTKRGYVPRLFLDEQSLLNRHLLEISSNTSTPHPKIKLQFAPVSMPYYVFKKSMKLFLDMFANVLAESELDEIRWWLSDDRLFQMVVSQVITMLHVVLEVLAFRDDWQFFTGRKNYRGLSASSLIFSAIKSTITLLYLYDSESSSLILFSVGKDVFYGFWKLTRVLRPRLVATNHFGFLWLPKIVYDDPSTRDAGEDMDITHKYDRIAVIHVGLCTYPVLIGSAIHSLMYFRHKSWWSWFVNALVDMVYLSGFIALTPQLYINYKLKSVAHLPVRAFMYKAFNTVIDDVFAFLIKLPLKHRLMTLRDDVVFLVFIYQWWIYPADKKRPNEFGFQYEETSSEQALIITDSTTVYEDGVAVEDIGVISDVTVPEPDDGDRDCLMVEEDVHYYYGENNVDCVTELLR